MRSPLLLLTALLSLATVAAPPVARAESDCFRVTREITDLQRALQGLNADLERAASDARAPLEARIAATQSALDAKREEAKECWYSIHVQAVRVSDSCPGAREAAIAPAQAAAWIEKANEVYRAARVRFEFDPDSAAGDWMEYASTDVNALSAELPGDRTWERGKAEGNEIASRFPRKVVILFRHGPDEEPTGGGFSGTRYDFVALPGYEVTKLCGRDGNAFLLAHEIGHYFGLEHTFRQFKTTAAASAALRAAGNKPDAFDGDRLAETPPEPYIEALQCAGDALVVLNGIPFPLLRDNVMSYYDSPTKTLTPKQAEIVRTWVERRFADAMDARGPYVPDVRRAYQFTSYQDGKVIAAADGASKENGAKIVVKDWSGDAAENWRLVPLVAGDAGYFRIVSAATGKCLSADGTPAQETARIILWDWLGAENQKWRFVQDENGEFRIEAKRGGKVLTAPESRGRAARRSTAAAGEAIQAPDKAARNQRWRLLPAGS